MEHSQMAVVKAANTGVVLYAPHVAPALLRQRDGVLIMDRGYPPYDPDVWVVRVAFWSGPAFVAMLMIFLLIGMVTACLISIVFG